MGKVTVLRLGHRLHRDDRLSTHVGLTSRALGADEVIYTDDKDDAMLASVAEVAGKWGGKFKVSYVEDWKEPLKEAKKKKIKIVHLTMYGEPLQKKISAIRKEKNLMIAVGGAKVPGQMYIAADYNVAVGSQPHSEVAALAVLLHEYFKGKELAKKFPKAKLRIEPQASGKKVIAGDRN